MNTATRFESPFQLTRDDLNEVFRLKYGAPQLADWGPRLRRSFGHYSPDDHYEATVAALVEPGCHWLDVGSGASLFPDNPKLARQLAARCGLLVGLDPDDALDDNPYLDRRAKCLLQDFNPGEEFDLATLRLVAEHIAEPEAALAALHRLVRRGGHVVVYTLHRWSPRTMLGRHSAACRMNTRDRLAELFDAHGFQESFFAALDDCRTFPHSPRLQRLEFHCWRLLKGLGMSYPEKRLLGVYERTH